jgi:hypothetical protein
MDDPPVTTTGVVRTAFLGGDGASKIRSATAARVVTPGWAFPDRNRVAAVSPAAWLTIRTCRPPLIAKSVSLSGPPLALNTPRLKTTLRMDRETGLVSAVNVTASTVGVIVAVTVLVAVMVGVLVAVAATLVGVGVDVAAAVAVGVRVAVAVGDPSGVGVSVGVEVGRGVNEAVAVAAAAVAVTSATAVAVSFPWTTTPPLRT